MKVFPMKLNALKSLLVGAALVASAPVLAAPIGLAESPSDFRLTRGEDVVQMATSPSIPIQPGDVLASGEKPIQTRLVDGTAVRLAPASEVSFGETGSMELTSGELFAAIRDVRPVKVHGLLVAPTATDEVSVVNVAHKSETQIEVISLSGAPVAVRDAATGTQLASLTPGEVMNFELSEGGFWAVQSPMVLQETEGIEDTQDNDDDRDEAAAPVETSTATGGGTGTTVAIGGGVVLVGGGVAVAASPRLRERLGISDDDDDDDEEDEPSSPIIPPPDQENGSDS